MPPFDKSYFTIFLFLWAQTVCSLSLWAQQPNRFFFQYYNSSHGLPSSEIISLAKDSNGFLWIGTSAGLSRYDGYNFLNYPYAKGNELIGYVNVIKPDAGGHLWIGSGAGLFCYINNQVIKISQYTSSPQGVNDILLENDGTIWLATENGPVKFQVTDADLSGKKRILLTDYILKQWNFKNAAIDRKRTILISKAPDGTVYIAQHSNLFSLANDKLDLIHSITDKHDKILSVFPLSKTKVWYDAAATEMTKIENGFVSQISSKKNYQTTVSESPGGTWYLGTSGIFYFNPQNGLASRFINTLEQGILWPSAMLKDDNFFWVASHQGLIKIKPSIFSSYTVNSSTVNSDYYAFIHLKNGKFLLGANRGKVFEKKDNVFSVFKNQLVPTAEIKSFFEDERGWLWVASGYQGLALIKQGKADRFSVENGLHDNSIYQFLKTGNGKLYVIGDQGLSEILVSKKNTVSFKKYLIQPNISQYAKFLCGIEAPDGTIWVGGEEGLFYLHNDSLYPFTPGHKQLFINSFIKDKYGKVWIAAAGEGILQAVFNGKNTLDIVKQFTEKDGLNSLHYLTLLADNENNIWAGSSKGISFIGQKGEYRDRVINYDESDGFIKPGYNYISLYQDAGDKIWAATTFGITSFKPKELFFPAASPVIYISGVRQIKKNEVISNRDFNSDSGTNKFPHNNNSFNFTFTSLDYANQENTRYFYKLEGLDTGWVNGISLRSVSYENLSSGKYVFRVKALNSKGRWSKQDAYYSFSITSPFWKRWWFISACIICLLASGFYLFKRKESSMKTKLLAKEKEMEVIKLNHDLAASKLTALRTQMNPHFIFNALNSVQQYILQGNVVEANKYLSKFSKLQREILLGSNKNFISLEKEIEILNTYLQLEQLRFGENFTYQINMTDEIDPTEINIPPMMLQPFVENAIWHGLMPRQGERNLDIHFDLYTDDILLATIRDNGIGRTASARLKQNNDGITNGHESKGMSMVHQRLQLLQQQHDKPFEAAVADITDVNGIVQGTQVALKIYIGN